MGELKQTTAADVKPGSDEAILAGCTCPVLDNAHGRGYLGQADVFVYSCGCPGHCPPASHSEEPAHG